MEISAEALEAARRDWPNPKPLSAEQLVIVRDALTLAPTRQVRRRDATS